MNRDTQPQRPGGRRSARIRRIALLGVGAVFVAGLYIARLAAIQVPSFYAPADSQLAVHAVRQRQNGLVLDSGRGRIVDRFGQSIAGVDIRALAAFPLPSGRRGTPEQLDALADALDTDAEALSDWLDSLQEPEAWRGTTSAATGGRAGKERPIGLGPEAEAAVRAAAVNGVHVVPYTLRYPETHSAAQAVGFISQHPEYVAELYASELAHGRMKLTDEVGGAGLEKSLDRLIRGAGRTVAYQSGHTAEVRITRPDNPYYPLTAVTTLDIELTQKLESYAEQAGLAQGAIVVLDAANGDIAAMVSRPSYDPHRIGADMPATANHALRAVAPGSIFKLVTEAAALDAKLASPGEFFHCDGEHEAYGLSCWLEGGHGTLTLQEALAQSCNVAFAQLAERLSAAQLERTADQLGLGRLVGWSGAGGPNGAALRPMGEEESGRIFSGQRPERDGGVLAQTGIGQRDVAVTPLQAANLVVTLLHHGEVHAPRLVGEIRYANGQRLAGMPLQGSASQYGTIARPTARTLLRGMEMVVKEGTGRQLQSAKWRLAGKSGTAQAFEKGRPTNHQWFIGYGPVESPRYAVAVLAEHRPVDSSNRATALFGGVMDIIAVHEASSAAVR
jgi:penicillin-binding protein 4B